MPNENEKPDQEPKSESEVVEPEKVETEEPSGNEDKEEKKDKSEASQDKPEDQKSESPKTSVWQRLKNWYSSHKKWSIPLTIIILLAVLAAIPWTRYKSAGLVLKQDFKVQVLDAATKSPVSGAVVSAGGISALTDGSGRANLRGLKVGNQSLTISKKYYEGGKAQVLVPILKAKSTPTISLKATGRQVKVTITNLIGNVALAGVDIKVADIKAKTDKSGKAAIVLPVGKATQEATLSLEGYNDAKVTIKVSDKTIQQNAFTLTPIGKVYFLSKRTGKLDLMKANLDGSSPEVVAAGTGAERDYETVLLASPDWKHLALVAKRNAKDPTPQLYVLSADNDKLLSADTGNADFSLVGWTGDSLVYKVTRNDIPVGQAGRFKLKSYNAATGKLTSLDQASAAGTGTSTIYETYGLAELSGSTVVYAKTWISQYYSQAYDTIFAGREHSLQTISASGQNHKTVASYDATKSNLQYSPHSPVSFYIWQRTYAGDDQDKYFDYTLGSSPKSVDIDTEKFYQDYPDYYISPSGKQTFWAENRDGKNTFMVGDSSGGNAKSVTSLSEHAAYGWFSDQYLLITKKASELLIISVSDGDPVKITDYQATNTYY